MNRTIMAQLIEWFAAKKEAKELRGLGNANGIPMQGRVTTDEKWHTWFGLASVEIGQEWPIELQQSSEDLRDDSSIFRFVKRGCSLPDHECYHEQDALQAILGVPKDDLHYLLHCGAERVADYLTELLGGTGLEPIDPKELLDEMSRLWYSRSSIIEQQQKVAKLAGLQTFGAGDVVEVDGEEYALILDGDYRLRFVNTKTHQTLKNVHFNTTIEAARFIENN
jgi:hypothetical protein